MAMEGFFNIPQCLLTSLPYHFSSSTLEKSRVVPSLLSGVDGKTICFPSLPRTRSRISDVQFSFVIFNYNRVPAWPFRVCLLFFIHLIIHLSIHSIFLRAVLLRYKRTYTFDLVATLVKQTQKKELHTIKGIAKVQHWHCDSEWEARVDENGSIRKGRSTTNRKNNLVWLLRSGMVFCQVCLRIVNQ